MRLLHRAFSASLSSAVALATIGAALLGNPLSAEAAPRLGDAFVSRIAPTAVASQGRTGVPASVTIAQAILESAWGASTLSSRYNNYFGIKCTRTTPRSQCVDLPTTEYVNGRRVTVTEPFRRYASADESFTDHARLVSTGYRAALPYSGDAKRFLTVLQQLGYASDPNYANAAYAIICSYDLTRFDRPSTATASSASGFTLPVGARAWIVERNAPAARVRVLQQALSARGYTVAVTGRWDAATVRVLRAFQAASGIRVDGVAGPKTWQRL
jgi:Mannosyl-glycoprotein endo-beta-N-acetylglucosaminidase/Putative peptidoglycan binding domain